MAEVTQQQVVEYIKVMNVLAAAEKKKSES